jgi:hypothetical protein
MGSSIDCSMVAMVDTSTIWRGHWDASANLNSKARSEFRMEISSYVVELASEIAAASYGSSIVCSRKKKSKEHLTTAVMKLRTIRK